MRALAIGLLLGFLLAPRAPAAAAGNAPLAHADSGRVSVYWRRADEKPEGVTRALAQSIAEWADQAITKYEALGFKKPCLRMWRGRYVIGIVDFASSGDPARAGGRYYGKDRKIRLNLSALHRQGRYPWDRGTRRVQATVAHEVFHAVQAAYLSDEDCRPAGAGESSWIKEATANWAADQVFPEVHGALAKEAVNLLHPGSFHWLEGRDIFQNSDAGRAYGASVFFRFWTKHADPSVVRRVWEECAKPGPNEFEAIGSVLGDPEAFGPGFRDLFDRFRVGCALRDDLPAGTELADADLLQRGTPRKPGPLRPAVESLTGAVAKYLADAAVTAAAPPLSSDVRLGPMETRYFAFLPPAGLAAGTKLDLSVTPADGALSLQVLVHDGTRYGVRRVVPPAGVTVDLASLPAGKGVAVIVTRYAKAGSKAHRLEIRRSGAAPRLVFSKMRQADLTQHDGTPVRILVGEVTNEGETAVVNPILRVQAPPGASGPRPAQASLTHSLLAPGATSPFTIQSSPEEVPTPRVEVERAPESSDVPVTGTIDLQDVYLLLTYDPRFEPWPRRVEVHCRIRNASAGTVGKEGGTVERVEATFLDDSGAILGVGSGGAFGEALAPGAKGTYLSFGVPLFEDRLAAVRLTASIDHTHLFTQTRTFQRPSARFVRYVTVEGREDIEVLNDGSMPVWPTPVWVGKEGGLHQFPLVSATAYGGPLPPGESRTFSDSFRSGTKAMKAGCWFPWEP